jgi:hypothetical protein
MMDEKTLAEIEANIANLGRTTPRACDEREVLVSIAAAQPALVAEVRRLQEGNEHLKAMAVEGGHEMRRRLAGAEEIGLAAIRRADGAEVEVRRLRGEMLKALRESGCNGDLCAHDWHETFRTILGEERFS